MEPIITMTRKDLEKLIQESVKYCFVYYLSNINDLKVYHQADELMTKVETANYLGVSIRDLNSYCRRGLLNCLYKGRGARFYRSEVIAFKATNNKQKVA